jgi:hypothetical protein
LVIRPTLSKKLPTAARNPSLRLIHADEINIILLKPTAILIADRSHAASRSEVTVSVGMIGHMPASYHGDRRPDKVPDLPCSQPARSGNQNEETARRIAISTGGLSLCNQEFKCSRATRLSVARPLR